MIKLAEALPQTSIATLECAACDSVIAPAIPTSLAVPPSGRDQIALVQLG